MRILYLSCHSVLEFDEVSLLTELGHYVFSPGAYVNPENRGEADLRPSIPGLYYDPEDVALYHACGVAGSDNKAHLSVDLLKRFDLVIVMHVPEWIIGNLDAFRKADIPIIWRTIGQAIEKQEAALRPIREIGSAKPVNYFPLNIVRYSPLEEQIPGYIGADAMIRFAKKPDEWAGWTGEVSQVLGVGQDVINRRKACAFDFWEEVSRPFPRLLIGRGSEAVRYGVGKVPLDELQTAMRRNRVFFYMPTHPASYTLGLIEAMMTGIPVVSVGENHGNSPDIPGHKLFEVPYLLNGSPQAGFASDDPFELADFLGWMLRDHAAAQKVGYEGQKLARSLFGWEGRKAEWKAYLKRFE